MLILSAVFLYWRYKQRQAKLIKFNESMDIQRKAKKAVGQKMDSVDSKAEALLAADPPTEPAAPPAAPPAP